MELFNNAERMNTVYVICAQALCSEPGHHPPGRNMGYHTQLCPGVRFCDEYRLLPRGISSPVWANAFMAQGGPVPRGPLPGFPMVERPGSRTGAHRSWAGVSCPFEKCRHPG